MKALPRFVVVLLFVAGSFYVAASVCISQGGVPSVVGAPDFEGYGRIHQPQSTSKGGQPLRYSSRPVNSPARGWQRSLQSNGNKTPFKYPRGPWGGWDRRLPRRGNTNTIFQRPPTWRATADPGIVFHRDGDIYKVDADGSNLTQLTTDPAGDYDPHWSPDHTKIVFECYREGPGQIYVMDADGSDQHNISNSGVGDWFPTWSPDGSRIAFSRGGEIWVMDSDGSNQLQVTTGGSDSFPTWCGDDRIVFHSNRDGDSDIWAVNSDGSSLTILWDSPYDDRFPACSPDGSTIAFSRDEQLWLMDPYGGNQGMVGSGIEAFCATWSPDASQLAFSVSGPGIHVVNIDGTGDLPITSGDDARPCWGMPAGGGPPPKSWTFLVYLDGDNDLEEWAIYDVNKMELVGSSADVNIVVQIDRIDGYDSSNGDWTTCRRYYVTYDTDTATINSTLLEELGEVNMGDGATLEDFITWGVANYPADNYALVLFDHGGGWRQRLAEYKQGRQSEVLRAVCWDDTSGGDALYTKEWASAISNAGAPLALVGFDVCLLGMIEPAYELAQTGLAEAMVASPTVEYAPGWPYDIVLADLGATPSMSGLALADVVVYRFSQSHPSMTMSAYDLSQMATASAAVDNLAATMISQNTEWNVIDQARAVAQTYWYAWFRDLRGFAEQVRDNISNSAIQSAASGAADALGNLISSFHAGSYYSAGRGVSVSFPDAGPESDYDGTYIAWAGDTQWDEFLVAFGLADTIPPPAPNLLPISNPEQDGDYLIDWDAVSDASGINAYRVQECEESTYLLDDDAESGSSLWSLAGFSLSTARAHSATHSYYSGSGDDLDVSMTLATPIALPASGVSLLSYWAWYDIETNWDYAYVRISANGGASWETLATYTGSADWSSYSHDISDYNGETILIRFAYVTDYSVIYEGIYFDDIVLSTLEENAHWDVDGAQTELALTGRPTGTWLYSVKAQDGAGLWSAPSNLQPATVALAPEITDWAIAATHGGGVGQIVITVADEYVEPRNCGISLLRICFTEPLDPATVSTDVIAAVGVNNGDCSAQVADVTVDGSCIWVEFSPVLPDQDTFEITVSTAVCDLAGNPLGGDRDRAVVALVGDTNSDMVVSTADMGAVRAHLTEPVTDDNARYDVNQDGIISTADMGVVRANLTHSAPPCPPEGELAGDNSAAQTLAAGWYRFAVPVAPEEPAPAEVLASLGEPDSDWLLYDYVQGRYYCHPDPNVRDFARGRGYWMRVIEGGTVQVSGTAAPPSEPVAIELPRGWSIIGCPFDQAVPWDDSHVQVSKGQSTVALTQAIGKRWLFPTIYGWANDAGARRGGVETRRLRLPRGRGNVSINPLTAPGSLQPWHGYLVFARRPCTLTITGSVSGARAEEPAMIKPRQACAEDWRIRLVATVNDFTDAGTTIGVNQGAVVASEPHPPLGPGVDLFVKTAEQPEEGCWGYALDLRDEPVGAATWELRVETCQADAVVTISWPDLSELPDNLVAYLVDRTTGQRLYMRTAQGYSFRTGANGAGRDLQVEVKERGASAGMVTSLAAVATGGGGAEIVFTLSTEASVDVTILNIAGRPIRQLAATQPCVRGVNRLYWDGRSTSGTRVPAGRYIVTMTARHEDGQQTRRICPLAIER